MKKHIPIFLDLRTRPELTRNLKNPKYLGGIRGRFFPLETFGYPNAFHSNNQNPIDAHPYLHSSDPIMVRECIIYHLRFSERYKINKEADIP